MEKERPISSEKIKATNDIQVKMIEMFYGVPAESIDEEKKWEWIAENSPKFREIIEEHPEYVGEYSENPEEVLEKIGSDLYGSKKKAA